MYKAYYYDSDSGNTTFLFGMEELDLLEEYVEKAFSDRFGGDHSIEIYDKYGNIEVVYAIHD